MIEKLAQSIHFYSTFKKYFFCQFSGSLNEEAGRKSEADYETAIHSAGFGKFHYWLLFVCGWANASDAVEILCISFVLPAATCDLELTTSDKGWLSAILFIGMLIGKKLRRPPFVNGHVMEAILKLNLDDILDFTAVKVILSARLISLRSKIDFLEDFRVLMKKLGYDKSSRSENYVE